MVLKARSTLIVLIPVRLAIFGAIVIYLKKSKFLLSGASLTRESKFHLHKSVSLRGDKLKMQCQLHRSKNIFLIFS